MEEYFTKELSNCCKLNFSNHVIKTQKPLLSPKNSPEKTVKTITKSEKKSLKRVQSDQALTMTKKTNRRVEFEQAKEFKQKEKEKMFNDYGDYTTSRPRIEATPTKQIKKVSSAQNLFPESIKKLEERTNFTDSSKKIIINELINYDFTEKISMIKMPETVQCFPVSMVQIQKNEYLPQRVFYVGQNPQPINFQQAPNLLNSRYQSPYEYEISNLSKNQVKKSFVKEKTSKISNQIKGKNNIQKDEPEDKYKIIENECEESLQFNKIYGEVDLEAEIKKDLMKSLDFNKTETQTDSNSNGLSVLIKSPSSHQSTIIPLESKLIKKGNWHDSFNYDRKYQTEKVLKIEKSENHLDAKIKIDRREKFKSIVSVNSEHESSESIDSIILEQHPQHLLSSKPLKNLL